LGTQVESKDQQTVDIKAKVDCLKVSHRRYQKARPNDEHQGQRHLKNDKGAAQARPAMPF
jgi:hypothetical protein